MRPNKVTPVILSPLHIVGPKRDTQYKVSTIKKGYLSTSSISSMWIKGGKSKNLTTLKPSRLSFVCRNSNNICNLRSSQFPLS